MFFSKDMPDVFCMDLALSEDFLRFHGKYGPQFRAEAYNALECYSWHYIATSERNQNQRKKGGRCMASLCFWEQNSAQACRRISRGRKLRRSRRSVRGELCWCGLRDANARIPIQVGFAASGAVAFAGVFVAQAG
jgi:hypothetical protein